MRITLRLLSQVLFVMRKLAVTSIRWLGGCFAFLPLMVGFCFFSHIFVYNSLTVRPIDVPLVLTSLFNVGPAVGDGL